MSNPYQQPNDSQPNPDPVNAPQPPAPVLALWPQRAAAGLIDGLIVGIPYSAAYLVGGKGLAFVIWALGAVALGVMEGRGGQTPGKIAIGLRTLRLADGKVLGPGLGIGRRLLHLLDMFACFLGYLWPLWDERRQTFADKIVNSVVVKTG